MRNPESRQLLLLIATAVLALAGSVNGAQGECQATELDKLIETALANNLDLIATWDRLAEARAIARRSDAALYPSLTGNGGASRTRSEIHKGPGGFAAPSGTTYTSSFSLGLTSKSNY